MELKYSPADHLTKITQSWIGTVLIIGAVLFPVLEFMDYFVSPENFKRFMIYRLVISAVLLLFYYLNTLKTSRPYQYIIGACATALCAVTVELAVLQSGGQSSTYYAAMLILAICALGFVPISMPMAFVLVAIIYSIYLLPIVLTEPITSGVFVSNNAFLISTFVIGLLLRYHNQKLIMTELQLREELSEDKRKLERHSDRLKDEVVEKTGELAISEQKYGSLFENANDGIAVLDGNGRIANVNSRFCESHGLERDAILGTPYCRLEAGDRVCEPDERFGRMVRGEALVYETDHRRMDGSRISFEISARAIDIGGEKHIQLFHRDITERKKLQEQLLQSQKMESMGVLAGGIAHDFNNILTAILGHAEVLRRRVKNDEFALRRIKTIEDAGKRAGLMVSKLLSFARKESFEMAPTDLNAVVADTVELLERTLIDRNIKATVKTERDLPVIRGDGIHLEQVITNLVMNAMDAMPDGGSIAISTSLVKLQADGAVVHPLLAPGKYAVLAVTDTGAGIPREIIDRIFDPFFTTKPVGKGTGLGLAMVYGIVKSHGGELRVESTEGAGTTFTLYFPATDIPAEAVVGKSFDFQHNLMSGNEGILVIDDESEVLSFVRDTLESHGYRVITTDTPVYAQDLFSRIADTVDVVITDMLMPHTNGAELAKQFKQVRPAVKVIGISGFVGGKLAQEAPDVDRFLKKPFDGASLLSAVRQVLP